MIRNLLAALVIAVLTASMASAQIADFTVHPTSFGTHNLSRSAPTPANSLEPQVWTKQIENQDYIVVVWASVRLDFGGTIDVVPTYMWKVLDKATGTWSTPQLVGQNPIIQSFGQVTVRDLYDFAPSITWTYAGTTPNGVDGFAIAVLESHPTLLAPEVVVYFFELDIVAVPPVWVQSPLRDAVNASESGFGDSFNPIVLGMPDGDIVVVWSDDAPAGNIGGAAGINPAGPALSPGFPLGDVYMRRFQQSFPAAQGPGMVDGAGASTVNVSNSVCFELWPDAVTNDGDAVILTWTSFGSAADDVGGLGPNSGPVGGVPQGGELWDTYLRRVRALPGATSLVPGTARNVTTAGGNGFQPSRIAYNPALSQIGLVFFDRTVATQVIAGVPNLNAVVAFNQATGLPIVTFDVFFGVFNQLNLLPAGFANVSGDTNNDNYAAVAGFGINGWAVAWSTQDGATQVNTRIETYSLQSGTLGSTSIKRLYPTQAVTIPSQVQVIVYGIHAAGNQALSIHFSHNGGNPDNLRPGEPQAQLNPNNANIPVLDAFMAYGEATSVPPSAGQLVISRVSINGDKPLDVAGGAVIPASIEAEVVLQNLNGFQPMLITGLNVLPPVGFTRTGQNSPVLPVIIPPSSTTTFNVAFDVNVNALVAGQNQFDVSALGTVNNIQTQAGSAGIIAVTGVRGALAGVAVTYVMNPSTVVAGIPTDVELSVTVSNGGQFPLQDLKLFGTFLNGFTPKDAKAVIFDPVLATAFVPSGGISTFTGTVRIGASVSSAFSPYHPALTLELRQQATVGTVTTMLASPITIEPNPNATLGGPQLGIINSGGSLDGCALNGRGGLPWILLAIAALCGGALMVRRRARA